MSSFVCLLLLVTAPAICSITFEPNKGQTDPQVRYLARTSAGVIFATRQEIILHREKSRQPVRISFENANPHAEWQPVDPTGHKIHYIVGRDASKHLHGLDSYRKLTRRGLYPGIDLILYGNDKNQLEYDLVVAPGADPSRIRIKAQDARIDPRTGDLVVRNTTRQHKPVVFQDNKTIAGRFKQTGKDTYGFEIAAYDRSKPLTIDPIIESREYIGGIGDDAINSVGPNGECAGTTTSVDFPGAPAGRRHGTDVFFRNSTATYVMGGSGDETAASTVIQSSYSVPVLGGTTNSRDLPTGNRGQSQFAGGATDGFVWTPGAAYASYVGSSGDDRIAAIVGTGSFAAVGSTTGADFPVLDFPSRPGGGWDAFLLGGESDSAGAFLRSMRLIGGSGDDFAHAIVQIDGGYVVAGETASPNFPLLNPIQSARRGATDAFIFRTKEFAIEATSLFGGSGSDRISALAFDIYQATIYAAGGTSSPADLPGIQAQSSQKSNAGGTLDAFYTSFDLGLSRVGRSSYLGGTGSEEALAVGFDAENRVFLAGRTSSRDFPQRAPLQSGFGGGTTDGFFAQFEPNGTLSHSTHFGGSGDDEILAMADVPRPSVANFQTGINLLIAGSTTSTDLPGRSAFPTFEARRSGTQEGFIARISNDGIVLPESIVVGKDTRKLVLLSIGDNAKAAAAGQATVRSSDAGRVLVAFGYFSAGSAADTIVWNSTSPVPESLYVECLTAEGEANIAISVPGYLDRIARVRCVQPELNLRVHYPLRLNAPSVQTDIVATATDPGTGIRDTSYYGILGPRRTVEVPTVSISSGSPQVVKPVSFRGAIPILSSPLSDPFLLEPVSIGQSVLSVSAPGYKPDQETITVTSAVGPPSILGIVAGFYLQQHVPYEVGLTTTAIRSTDPSKVLLVGGLSGSSPTAAITLRFPVNDYRIHGLAGTPVGSEVPIEMSFNGGPWLVTRTVRFEAPALAGTQPMAMTLAVGETNGLYYSIQTSQTRRNVVPLPGTILSSSISVENPTPSVLAATPSAAFVELRGLAEGSTTLTIRPPAGFGFTSETNQTVSIRVVPAATFRFPDFDLGKDLLAARSVQLPRYLSSTTATVSTSTPDLIQLQNPANGPIASSINITSVQVFSFLVHGKAAQGEGKITFTVNGFPAATATVRLRPSGFVWNTDQIVTATSLAASYALAAIDPVSGLPLQVQQPGPQIAQLIPTIDSSNPGVARFLQPVIFAVTPGEAILSLRQPAGFTAAGVRQRLNVRILRAPQDPTNLALHLTSTAGGSIAGSFTCPTLTGCSQLVPIGAILTITAVPATGYHFARWEGIDTCATAGITCTVPTKDRRSEISVAALFEKDTPGLQFLPLAPCRLVDTRNPTGPLGGPALLNTRNFPIRGTCNIPTNAAAYSLNVTVVPRGQLGYISIWPGGEPQPVVSTLNALDGRIKANAAIVPAGTADGSINVFATNLTDLIIDVNGVFVPPGPNTQAFYTVTPCRIADTRIAGAGGTIAALTTRAFTITNVAGCGVPVSATAYALNITAVPKTALGFLTLWPNNGTPRPTVSTLNALTGTVTANLAIVPAGTSGDVNAYVTDATETIVDVTGYFAPPGQPNALSFRPLAPCRVIDTRSPDNIMNAISTREIPLNCGAPPATAKAYSLNATVLPTSILGYLTLFPAGVARPVVSTLNAVDGSLTSNAAIVPAGLNGAISAFVTERTHLILDINGYFAP